MKPRYLTYFEKKLRLYFSPKGLNYLSVFQIGRVIFLKLKSKSSKQLALNNF